MTADAPWVVAVPVCTVWTAPDAPRDVDAPALRDVPDVPAWCRAMDQDTRRGLVGRTLTQALLGEPVRVLEERDAWVRVACPWQPSRRHAEGYPGWVRRAHLREPGAPEPGAPEPGAPEPGAAGAVVRVATRSALLSGPAAAPQKVSLGTTLRAAEHDARSVSVRLPDGGLGRLPRAGIRLDERAPAEAARDEAVSVAGLFLGLRYLWGGTSGWGVDCSGLVHLAYRSLGVRLPRDAHDQAESPWVEPVPLDSVERGDLYFFARPGSDIHHVGFASRDFRGRGDRWMLHAPEGGELVEDAPLATDRLETLVAAGRVVCSGTSRSGYDRPYLL